MQDQLASRLAWIDKLHEVGDPILRRRSAVLEMNEQAQRMEREARALRGRATGACLGLIDAVIQNWTSEEIARAQAAAPKTGRPGASSVPLLPADARSERLVWETLLHLAGDAPGASALANIVMAWNTSQMQAVLNRWANRRQVIPQELIGRIAPTRLEGINLRGVFRFPIERYAAQLLPSQTAAKTSATG